MLAAPALLQILLLGIDERVHRRRGLGAWEAWGHPLDALVFGGAIFITVRWPWSAFARDAFAAVAIVSCLLITKDEAVHARACGPFEQWLHAVLFMLHPLALLGVGVAWSRGAALGWRTAYGAASLGFAAYQVIYWSRRARDGIHGLGATGPKTDQQ